MYSINNVKIELHADDYGQTVNTSRDILELMKMGRLDGISILPNMASSEEAILMMTEAISELQFVPLISVHLDLVEGRMLSEEGKLIPWKWKDLFLASYHMKVTAPDGTAGYKQTYESLKAEVASQLDCGIKYIERIHEAADAAGVAYTPQKLRIDSHQHAHMLPIVWKTIMEVVSECGYEVEYIRNSHELLGPFLKNASGSAWKPVNIIKNRILAFYAPKVERYIAGNSISGMYLWGLIMSGHMDMERIRRVMPDMIKRASKKGYSLELNIHPGMMLEEEMNPEIPEISAKEFYLSEDRMVENETVKVFHDYLKNY